MRVVARSPKRDDLDEAYWQARAAAPKAILGEHYTGKVEITEGMVAVL